MYTTITTTLLTLHNIMHNYLYQPAPGDVSSAGSEMEMRLTYSAILE